MAKWDFKIVGASFVKELVPVDGDVNPRSQSFMQPSFHLEGGKIVIKESGQYVTAIYFSQIGEIDGVAPTDIEDALAKLLALVENFNGGGGTPQNLAQTLVIDNKTNDILIVSNNGNAVVDVNDDYISLGYKSQSFAMTDDDVQLYSEAPVVFDSTVSTDFNTPVLNYNTEEVATKNWVTSQGGGNLPYQELIFTAVQTGPQTGITSGTLIEGGRYTITNADITADFVISGAADNEIGTIFIANATPPDWGVSGELSFEGNPIVTILNNPLSDTYTSHYTDPGCYYLEGLLDFPVDTFPKLGADDYVDNVIRSQSDGTGLISKSYLWHKDNFNDKRILIKTLAGGSPSAILEDDQLNGTQLFIVKIFNS